MAVCSEVLRKMIFKLFALSAALFGSLALGAFPGGPYTIWSASLQLIHLDNPGLGLPINGAPYLQGRRNQYWSPLLASAGTTDVYYINSNVTGSIFATGASGAGLVDRPFASPWRFTPVAGTTDNFTIGVPDTDLVFTVASGSAFPLAITLQPLVSGNLRQVWSLTDHGPPSSINAPA